MSNVVQLHSDLETCRFEAAQWQRCAATCYKELEIRRELGDLAAIAEAMEAQAFFAAEARKNLFAII